MSGTIPAGCIEWSGTIAANGYGVLRHDGKQKYAHRVSYEDAFGEIPAGMCVCHSCDNRKCVNPKHLWLGTKGDNAKDRDAKGRHWVRSGESHPNAKLTARRVKAIRNERMGWRAAKLRFGISRSVYYAVLSGDAWKHAESGH